MSDLFMTVGSESSSPLTSPNKENGHAHIVTNLLDHHKEDNDCKINMLNDYCLRHVFSFLSQKELINIERVCKWWRTESLLCWHSRKHVTFKEFVPAIKQYMGVSGTDKFIIPDEILEFILKRCGKYVKSLDIKYHCNGILLIVKYCPVLKHLTVCDGIETTELGIGLLSELEDLQVYKCVGKNKDVKLARLFELCPNVKRLEFLDTCLKGMCLSSLNLELLEKLVIDSCSKLRMESFIPSCKKMKNLKSLTMDGNFGVQSHYIQILGSFPKLEHLVFHDGEFPSAPMPHIGISKNLISLDINNNFFVIDEVLYEIADNCVKLESLDLSECQNISYKGVFALSKLPSLKFLKLNFMRYSEVSDFSILNDDILEQFALRKTLVKLEIRQNSGITDEGCGKILAFCEELEYFDLSNCVYITDATVSTAEAAVKCRTNNKKLELVIGATKVKRRNWEKGVDPLLILNFNDYIGHRTPDYDSSHEYEFDINSETYDDRAAADHNFQVSNFSTKASNHMADSDVKDTITDSNSELDFVESDYKMPADGDESDYEMPADGDESNYEMPADGNDTITDSDSDSDVFYEESDYEMPANDQEIYPD